MRPPRRPSSTSSASDAGNRIASLLAAPAGGWLPPEQETRPPEQETRPSEQETRPPEEPRAGGRGGQVVGAEAVEARVEPRSWDADPDDPLDDDPRSWDADPDDPLDDDPLDLHPDPPDPSPKSAGLPGRLTGLLPPSVRHGRLDPGRRGAAALVAVTLLAALAAWGVVLRGRPEQVAVPDVVDRGRPVATSGPGSSIRPGNAADDASELVVAVAGQVVRPGVVRLPTGSRVGDAVAAAGGALPGASTGLLNLARKVVDGEQVLVGGDPAPGAAGQEGPVGRESAAGRAAAGGRLDLNTATATDLDALPGIGPVLAQRIVDWRVENDRFGSVEQLREVTGIGEAKFQDLKAKVTV